MYYLFMKVKRVIRRGASNSRVELEDGTVTLVPNTDLESNIDATAIIPVKVSFATEPAPKASSTPQSVADRFAHLASLTDLVIQGQSPSLIVCGDPGIGKTYLIRNRLKSAGLEEIAVSADAGDAKDDKKDKKKHNSDFLKPKKPNPAKSYLFIKGYSSPMGLYQTLHDNRQATIVFDDCDSVFKNDVAVNILKSALDSYDTRIVTWASAATEKMGLDSRFEFKGKIIFISNIPLTKLDSAVKDRSFTVEVTLTRFELWQRMYEVLNAIEPQVNIDIKSEVLNHMATHLEEFTEFSMRTLIKAIRLRLSNHPDWKAMVLKFA